jgi:iron complex outermembrane receptor protein
MKIKLLKQFMFVAIMLCASVIFAQTVSGTVTGDDGPLPGVNVIVKGTSNGTATDFDGNYSIDIASADAILEFSFIGFSTQEITVNGQTVINVELLPDAQALDEVIVSIGYGSIRKKDATGAVETLKPDDFNQGVTSSPQQLLQGRVAGVNVTSASGEPGGATSIRIRGATSIRAGNNPLVVVDGVPLDGRNTSPGSGGVGFGSSQATNPLDFINPDDIASIDVLKDASATAIYGSRGSNGVIMITTKRGRVGKTEVTLSAYGGVSNAANTPDILDGPSYAAALVSEGGATGNDFGENVDAMDAILRTGITQNYALGFSGGNERDVYRVSFGYLDQEGVVENTGLQKYTANFNNTFKMMDDKIKIDTKILYNFNHNDRAQITDDAGHAGNLIGSALMWNPTQALRNADGSIRQGYDGSYDNGQPALTLNPLALLEYNNDYIETSRIVGSIAASYEIIDGLTYKFMFGVDRSESTRRASQSRFLDVNGVRLEPSSGLNGGNASVNQIYLFSKLFEHTLEYQTDINDDIDLNAIVGYAYQELSSRGDNAFGENIDIDPGSAEDFLGGFSERTISSYKDPSVELQSFFGRVNMSFYDKILFTATLRADGSSKFGENNKYGYFPAFAAAWRIGDEDFSGDFFDDLKLRAGWGQTGNQEFPAGAAQERFAIGFDANGNTTATLVNVANPDLKWETTTTFNFGIDFGLLNNRLWGSIDYFNKNTEDLLFQQDVIQPAPATKFWVNLDGQNVNSGVEITLNGRVIQQEDWDFDLSANVSFLNNELKDFPFDDDAFQTGNIDGPGLSNPRSQRLADGQPINVYKLAVFRGFDGTGNPVYDDGNGGLTQDANLYKTFVGDPNPDVLVGFNAYLRWRNLNLKANFNGQYGAMIYNNTANATFIKSNLNASRNIAPSSVGNGETVSVVNAISTRFLESGDFLRLSDLTLSYNFERDMLPEQISGIRLYATGQNVFIITDYTGFDPEVNQNKAADGIPSYGIEYQPYPRSRTFSFGVNFTF